MANETVVLQNKKSGEFAAIIHCCLGARGLGSTNVIRRRSSKDALAKERRVLERNRFYNKILIIKKFTA